MPNLLSMTMLLSGKNTRTMVVSRTKVLGRVWLVTGLAAGACALLTTGPVAAQTFKLTLNGVTFDDGAMASGFFEFDPDNDRLGNFDITTTNGLTDGAQGFHYTPASRSDTGTEPSDSYFVFNTAGPDSLFLFIEGYALKPGAYPILPGTASSPNTIYHSGEFVSNPNLARVITAGTLMAAPVPEASSVVSFGTMLALGLSGAVIARKRPKSVPVE